MIEKASGLNSLKKLRILSLGRNYIKSFSGMVRTFNNVRGVFLVAVSSSYYICIEIVAWKSHFFKVPLRPTTAIPLVSNTINWLLSDKLSLV